MATRSVCRARAYAWVAIGLSALLSACAHDPIISDPAEGPNDAAKGNVTEISKDLEGKTDAVAVFIHGVGDHCPGFALNETDGWLRDKTLPALGLVPVPNTKAQFDIPDHEFLPDHPLDPASKVTVATETFDFQISTQRGTRQHVSLLVVELTWSQLTQWVKTVQLGYDLTKAPTPPADAKGDCPFTSTAPPEKKPPARVYANRLIKEQLLDRSLADAMLYTGTYGRVMRRGIAEGLCRALHGAQSANGTLCKWPTVTDDSGAPEKAYFFITHSLGSRMLYDTLLGLTGVDVTSTAGTFSEEEITNSTPFVDQLLIDTGSVYMMANQLPMLGLAYEDGTHTSTDPPSSYDQVVQKLLVAENTRQTPVEGGRGPTAAFRTSLVALGVRRKQAFANHPRATRTFQPLKIVAFSDPNDLLSWGIPNWYQRDAGSAQSGLTFTNVYVHNATHWLGLYESPSDAHDNYFTKLDVWQVIRCGAVSGALKPCPAQ